MGKHSDITSQRWKSIVNNKTRSVDDLWNHSLANDRSIASSTNLRSTSGSRTNFKPCSAHEMKSLKLNFIQENMSSEEGRMTETCNNDLSQKPPSYETVANIRSDCYVKSTAFKTLPGRLDQQSNYSVEDRSSCCSKRFRNAVNVNSKVTSLSPQCEDYKQSRVYSSELPSTTAYDVASYPSPQQREVSTKHGEAETILQHPYWNNRIQSQDESMERLMKESSCWNNQLPEKCQCLSQVTSVDGSLLESNYVKYGARKENPIIQPKSRKYKKRKKTAAYRKFQKSATIRQNRNIAPRSRRRNPAFLSKNMVYKPNATLDDGNIPDNFYSALFATFCCFFPFGVVSLICAYKIRIHLKNHNHEKAHLSSLIGRKFAQTSIMLGMTSLAYVLVYFLVKANMPFASVEYDYYLPEYPSG